MYYKEEQDPVADKNGNHLWRPVVVRTKKEVGTRELSKMISNATTLTEVEVYGVLHALSRFMNIHLKEGHTVRLDGLGKFIVYGRSAGNGVLRKEDVRPSQFNSIMCRFTPEYTVSADGQRECPLLDGIEFMHVDRLVKKSKKKRKSQSEE